MTDWSDADRTWNTILSLYQYKIGFKKCGDLDRISKKLGEANTDEVKESICAIQESIKYVDELLSDFLQMVCSPTHQTAVNRQISTIAMVRDSRQTILQNKTTILQNKTVEYFTIVVAIFLPLTVLIVSGPIRKILI